MLYTTIAIFIRALMTSPSYNEAEAEKVRFADVSSTSRPVTVKKSLTLRSTLRSSCNRDCLNISRDIEAAEPSNTNQASCVPTAQPPPLSFWDKWTKVATRLASLNARWQAPTENQYDEYAPGYEVFEYESYEKQPEGWPQLASFMDTCDSFSIFRRFGQSHARILVNYMVDITAIEKRLLELDKSDIEPEGKLYRLRNRKRGTDTSKEELLALMEDKLLRYTNVLLGYRQLKALDQTSERDHKSVFRWIFQNKPVDKGEYDFINYPEDFIYIIPPKRNPFEALIWNYICSWPKCWLRKLMKAKKKSSSIADERVEYLSKERITTFAKLAIVFLAVSVLFIPVVLFLLTTMSRTWMSVVVLTFVFLFSIIMSLFTEARVQEIFVGTATYSAVLVTFLGNLQNVGSVGAKQ